MRSVHREESWVDRFTQILPKEEISRQLCALHDDLRTPWTWNRIAREIGFKLRPFVIARACKTGLMNPFTQAVLSAFVNDIASGRLRVSYKNLEARRHVWGSRYTEDVEEYHARRAFNKITRKKTPVAQIAEVKQLQVTLGRSGPKLKPQIKYVCGNDMPAFNEVVHIKEAKK